MFFVPFSDKECSSNNFRAEFRINLNLDGPVKKIKKQEIPEKKRSWESNKIFEIKNVPKKISFYLLLFKKYYYHWQYFLINWDNIADTILLYNLQIYLFIIQLYGIHLWFERNHLFLKTFYSIESKDIK